MGIKFSKLIKPLFDHLHLLLAADLDHRIGARASNNKTVHDLIAPDDDAGRLQLIDCAPNEILIRAARNSVTAEDKIFDGQRVYVRIASHVRGEIAIIGNPGHGHGLAMDIDPVVRKSLATDHEIDRDMITIPQSLGRSLYLGRRRGLEHRDEFGERRTNKEISPLDQLRPSVFSFNQNRLNAHSLTANLPDRRIGHYASAAAAYLSRHIFIGLSGTQSRVNEFVDESS